MCLLQTRSEIYDDNEELSDPMQFSLTRTLNVMLRLSRIDFKKAKYSFLCGNGSVPLTSWISTLAFGDGQ